MSISQAEIATWHHYLSKALVDQVEKEHGSISEYFGEGEDGFLMDFYPMSETACKVFDNVFNLVGQESPGVPLYELPAPIVAEWLRNAEGGEPPKIDTEGFALSALKVITNWFIEKNSKNLFAS